MLAFFQFYFWSMTEETEVVSKNNIFVDKVIKILEIQQKLKEETTIKNFSKEDIELIAKMVAAEARGEPYEGQVAVAEVIINRVETSGFPDTVYDVLHQKNQFTPVDNGSFYKISPTEVQYQAVEEAISGSNIANGALFFYNPKKSSVEGKKWFKKNTEHVVTIGNHEFRKSK